MWSPHSLTTMHVVINSNERHDTVMTIDNVQQDSSDRSMGRYTLVTKSKGR